MPTRNETNFQETTWNKARSVREWCISRYFRLPRATGIEISHEYWNSQSLGSTRFRSACNFYQFRKGHEADIFPRHFLDSEGRLFWKCKYHVLICFIPSWPVEIKRAWRGKARFQLSEVMETIRSSSEHAGKSGKPSAWTWGPPFWNPISPATIHKQEAEEEHTYLLKHTYLQQSETVSNDT